MAKRKKVRWTAESLKKKPRKKAKRMGHGNTGAPFCKVCRFHHWGRDPHIFPKDAIKYDDCKIKE